MIAMIQPPLPSSPTGGEGQHSARNNHSAPSRPIAPLPPLWGRAGVGGRRDTTQPTKAPK